MRGSAGRNRQHERLVGDTMELTRALKRVLSDSPEAVRSYGGDWWAAVQAATGTPGGIEELLELLARTFGVAATLLLASPQLLLRARVRNWLLASANPFWRGILADVFFLLLDESPRGEEGVRRDPAVGAALARIRQSFADRATGEPGSQEATPREDVAFDFFEHFLAAQDAGRRRSHGVFYTPRPIARFIVKQIDRCLREEFGVRDGLAGTDSWADLAARHAGLAVPQGVQPQEPFVQVLDPALGTGVFLEEMIDLVYRRFRQGDRHCDGSAIETAAAWNAYVHRHLLPRLFGLEIMLPACVAAYLRLAESLARTDFSFQQASAVEIHLADTLAGPCAEPPCLFPDPANDYTAAVDAGRRVALCGGMTVVVGNPPFSGISRADGRWIVRLLHGSQSQTPQAANYYQVAGHPLGERKVWLQDDYVKFFRFAHWKIEQAGVGLLGLVTNHGYLDNPTFRGMRYQLLKDFSRIDVIDLHGNRKKKERCPDGSKDENVFGIEQGTAIGLLRRLPKDGPTDVRYGELWGAAGDKLGALQDAAASCAAPRADGPNVPARSTIGPATRLEPAPPNFFFVPRDEVLSGEYRQARRLADIMPVNVTAPVTARDGFVVAFDREELHERLQRFRDLSVPDTLIRDRYFTHTRSDKYPPGDTRGWRLSEARRQLAADPGWSEKIRRCWYRPFDRRWIYWSPAMIDWPRDDVVCHLLSGENLALVARRQMLPSQPCNYFWIVDGLTIDGVIRSDNRGSESIFPLYLYRAAPDGRLRREINLEEDFVASLRNASGLVWIGFGAGDLVRSFGAEDVLHYAYAMFHCPTYRQRYADLLRSDFPRVFTPRDAGLFADLCRQGRRLAAAHLLRTPAGEETKSHEDTRDGSWFVAAGYPKYDLERVHVNPSRYFEKVKPQVWQFHVGAHQVCRKWLKDRRGRQLGEQDRAIYRGIVRAVETTLDATKEIGAILAARGGWPAAFC